MLVCSTLQRGIELVFPISSLLLGWVTLVLQYYDGDANDVK